MRGMRLRRLVRKGLQLKTLHHKVIKTKLTVKN